MQRRLRNLFSLNKKGMLYEIGLIFFVIIILSAALYNILTSQSLTSQIGKTPADIIRVDKEAKLKENLRTYLRSSFNDLTKQEKLNFYNIDINILDNKLIVVVFNGQNLKFSNNNNVEYTIHNKFRKQAVYDLNKIIKR